MDAMALLCNLHADGPTTVDCLRRAGCATLEDVRSLSPERLAEILDASPAAARRFLREVEILSERIGMEPLEREEPDRPATTLFHPATMRVQAPTGPVQGPTAPIRAATVPIGATTGPTHPAQGEGVTRPAPERREPGPTPTSRLDAKDRDLVQRVLQSWRKADELEIRMEPPPERTAPAPIAFGAGLGFGADADADAVVDDDDDDEPAPAPEPARPPARSGALSPGLVDGLDQATCARLGAIGVRTLAQLIAAPAEELAVAAGTGYSGARRLQYLARRAQESPAPAPAPAPAGEEARPGSRHPRVDEAARDELVPAPRRAAPPRPAQERISLAFPAPLEAEAESAGGPFA